ncbi:F-box only protein 31 [Lingula anatina]|uniref:F-box only protein 31 n=1 Tax=Lingula anatina TaxID=7574 RepID=A0A2R2MMA4_LINAN|nr:F-box only protein 31 [Lingula anatina]|eukprot:XP_023931335.1 F-box only protein 31 [Lingula anatina]
MEQWFSEWLGTDLGDGDQMDDYYEHQLLIRRFKYTHIPELECKRLSWPTVTAHPVLRPGLFKASYGAHGTELILVSYKGLEMQGYKVSGDPNVPAGQISIRADLTQSLILSEEQQSSVQLLTDIDLPDAAPAVATALEQLPPQPFFLPYDCSYREPRNDCPKKCKARFLGKLQIAGHGFQDPRLTPMHWIVFNEDLFGVLWLDLRNFFTFHRVETDF